MLMITLDQYTEYYLRKRPYGLAAFLSLYITLHYSSFQPSCHERLPQPYYYYSIELTPIRLQVRWEISHAHAAGPRTFGRMLPSRLIETFHRPLAADV
jgi:hypothetical protein